jgi:hypothetical protein
MLCQRNNDADNTAEEVIYSIEEKAETYLSYRLYMTSKMTEGRQDIHL